jgi:serine/threonine-protein kinase
VRGTNLEQRKAAWLARAYAAQLQCLREPAAARAAFDAALADMQQALPEGGALPREVQRLRDACGASS